MISASVGFFSFFLLIQQFIGPRHSPFFRLILTFSYCIQGFLREQELETDRRYVRELWAIRPRINWGKVICVWELHVFFHQYVADLRDERSGKVVLLMSALRDSQPEVDHYVPQSAFQTVKSENVLVPTPPDTEQQCRQLQHFRMCRTSESRQPPLLCSLSAVSSACMLPQKPPEFPSSSSSIDRFQRRFCYDSTQ